MKPSILILSMLFALTASAETGADILDKERQNNTDTLPAGEDTTGREKYYTNWIGEECVDFGDDGKTYYNWKRDITYTGIPILLSSFIIKDQKKAFRSARFEFQDDFKSNIDSYTQFVPYGVLIGLKAVGYKGRSSWDRLLVSTIFANVIMASAVNITKCCVNEIRPDNTTNNSFPSGHTATAFVAATVLHKEYGLTRSPWFSIGGYGIATATGVMRVLNNRHWVSDVVAGAGIGILSTELGYFFGDLIYKSKGICHRDLVVVRNKRHPSFFDIQMGIGIHGDEINFDFGHDTEGPVKDRINLGTSTVFGLEGAYFINKYIGLGGIARVTTTPARELDLDENQTARINGINSIMSKYTYISPSATVTPLPGIYNWYIDNANFVDASLDLGVYLDIPLGGNFDLGAKMLAGRRFSGGISYKAYNGTPKTIDGKIAMDEENAVILDGEANEYEIMRVTGGRSFNGVCGLSLTWHYKDNYTWKVFVDYDCAKNGYTYRARYFSDEAMSSIATSTFPSENPELWNNINHLYTASISKFLNFITIGGAFTVNF